MKATDVARRVTGFSTPFGGVSWQPSPSEAEAARRLVTFLEDRRVLYAPYDSEFLMDCVDSVLKIREHITTELQGMPTDWELSQSMRAMRAACRKFLDGTQDTRHGRRSRLVMPPWIGDGLLVAALGELRGVFGVHLARIATAFEIDVEDELATILPAEDAG